MKQTIYGAPRLRWRPRAAARRSRGVEYNKTYYVWFASRASRDRCLLHNTTNRRINKFHKLLDRSSLFALSVPQQSFGTAAVIICVTVT
jgi:hypothetical protein